MNDNLLNHTEIYTLLYNGNINSAIKIFQNKTKGVTFTPSARTSYLSSLNYGIYNYFLFKEKISLYACCMENEKKISLVTNESIVSTGIDIITTYGFDRRCLIEKYQSAHVKSALYYIHNHLNEPLTLENVSSAANISPSYLCRLFRREVGTSFSNYIQNSRIKLAQELLNCSDYPIQRIAEQCGFKTAAYFSTCYKKIMGYLPSEERREQHYH